MRKLVLASTSPYRRDLLARLEVPFAACAPPFDERAEDPLFSSLGPLHFALHLARGKAESVRSAHPDALILAADQVAVLPGPPDELLHKPGSEEQAVQQLMRLSGRTFLLVSGVVLLDGLVPHYSKANRSSRSRHAYTLHVVSGEDAYPQTNWLQRTIPARGFS